MKKKKSETQKRNWHFGKRSSSGSVERLMVMTYRILQKKLREQSVKMVIVGTLSVILMIGFRLVITVLYNALGSELKSPLPPYPWLGKGSAIHDVGPNKLPPFSCLPFDSHSLKGLVSIGRNTGNVPSFSTIKEQFFSEM